MNLTFLVKEGVRVEREYLVMKLGNIKGVDFFKEHSKVIEEYGYVDFARAGRRFLNFAVIKEPYFYIKENAQSGNRVFKAFISKEYSGEKRTPQYYTTLNLSNASWVRITGLEIVDKERLISEYTLRNGNDIKALDRGAVSFFYIIKKKDI